MVKSRNRKETLTSYLYYRSKKKKGLVRLIVLIGYVTLICDQSQVQPGVTGATDNANPEVKK